MTGRWARVETPPPVQPTEPVAWIPEAMRVIKAMPFHERTDAAIDAALWMYAHPVQPTEPIAWLCTRRLTGDKASFDPVVTANYAYVLAHPDHDWRPLIESNSDKLSAQIVELQKALAFYADESDYKGGWDNDGDGHYDQYGFDILEDKGATARAAIAGKEGN